MRLIVYTTPACGYCAMLKQWLAERSIPYVEKDTTNPAYGKEFKKYNVNGTPFLVYGRQTLLGFRPDEINKMLGRPAEPQPQQPAQSCGGCGGCGQQQAPQLGGTMAPNFLGIDGPLFRKRL
jgi:glutaredoxin